MRGTSGPRRAARAWGVASALLLAARPVGAQEDVSWRVASAHLEADLTQGDGSAAVTLDWVLVPSHEDAPLPMRLPIPLDLLGFGAATAEEVVVDGARVVRLESDAGSHRSAALTAPEREPAAALPISFSYRVASAVELDGAWARGRIPVLTGPPAVDGSRAGLEGDGARPGPSGGDVFSATLRLPEGWSVGDAFPSGLRRGDDGAYRVTLPVTPAMLAFRARTDGAWRPGFPLVVDVLTVLVLLGFAAVGWRHLRGLVA